MRFGINDLKEFEITESEVVCTTSFVKPIHIVLASNCELYGSKTFRFKYQKPLDYAYNMKYHCIYRSIRTAMPEFNRTLLQ